MGLLALSVVAFLLIGAACFGLDLGRYDNSFNGVLSFRCHDASYAVTRVRSYHSNQYEDRRFDISCSKIYISCSRYHHKSCYWTGFINAYDAPIHYSCRSNYYINGLYSVHNNHYQDRRWKLRCCQISGVGMKSCVHSGWTNNYDKYQNYRAPTGHVITGVFSVHKDYYEDRRYGYMVCKVGARSTEQPASLMDNLGVQPQDQQKPQQQLQQQPASLMEYLGVQSQDLQKQQQQQQSNEEAASPLVYLGEQKSIDEADSPLEYLGEQKSIEEAVSPLEYLGEQMSTEEAASPLEYLGVQLEEQ